MHSTSMPTLPKRSQSSSSTRSRQKKKKDSSEKIDHPKRSPEKSWKSSSSSDTGKIRRDRRRAGPYHTNEYGKSSHSNNSYETNPSFADCSHEKMTKPQRERKMIRSMSEGDPIATSLREKRESISGSRRSKEKSSHSTDTARRRRIRERSFSDATPEKPVRCLSERVGDPLVSNLSQKRLSGSKHSMTQTLRSLRDTIGLDDLPSSSHRSTFQTLFDVDIPTHRAHRRRPSIGTVESQRAHMTGEERAWAGINDILDGDDGESVMTKEVLPKEIIEAMNRSFGSILSVKVRSLDKDAKSLSWSKITPQVERKDQAQYQKQIQYDEQSNNSEESHDNNMKQLCGYLSPSSAQMPGLMDMSFSSMQSETSAVSLLSYVTSKNLIKQEAVTDTALKGFLGNITKVLERKQQVSQLDPGSTLTNPDPIFDMFVWSQKENVDQETKDIESKKKKRKKPKLKKVTMNDAQLETTMRCSEQEPNNGFRMLLKRAPSMATEGSGEYPYDERLAMSFTQSQIEVQAEANFIEASMNSDFFGGQNTAPSKNVMNTFSDSMPSILPNQEPASNPKSEATVTFSHSLNDIEYGTGDGMGIVSEKPSPIGDKNRKTKVKIKKKTIKKKKKKKTKSPTTEAVPERAEDFTGFFRKASPDDGNMNSKRQPARPRSLVKTLSRTFIKQEKANTEKKKSPDRPRGLKGIKSRMTGISLFNKQKEQNSFCRQEAHFFDDFLEKDEDDGALLAFE